MLHVRRQFTRLGEFAPPKTKAAIRRIPLSDEMTKYLAALKLRSRHSADEDPVFAARNGKPLGHRNATRRGFEAAATEAGIEDVTFHSMRHGFASRMIDRGISSTVLASLMGHESSTITERRYVHLFDPAAHGRRRAAGDGVRHGVTPVGGQNPAYGLLRKPLQMQGFLFGVHHRCIRRFGNGRRIDARRRADSSPEPHG